MLYYVDKLPNFIDIGEEAENIAVNVEFDYTAWAELHGPGAAQLLVQRPQDLNPYPAVTTTADDVLSWKPTQTDTAFVGRGKIQLIYSTADEVLEKSPIVYIMTGDSLEGAGDPPEPYEDWIDSLTDLAADAIQSAQDAAESAEEAEAAKDAVVGEASNLVWRLDYDNAVELVAPTEVTFELDSDSGLYKHIGEINGFSFDSERNNKYENVYVITFDGQDYICPMWDYYTQVNSASIGRANALGNSSLINLRNPFNSNAPFVINVPYVGSSTYEQRIYTSESGQSHAISVKRIPVMFGPIYQTFEPIISHGEVSSGVVINGADGADANGFAVGRAAYAYTRSTAIGQNSRATQDGTVAIGTGAKANGMSSAALGSSAAATGAASCAVGFMSEASGETSTAIGQYVSAASKGQVVLGRYNVVDSAGTYALILGDGTKASARKNLFTIAHDGTVVSNGKTLAKAEDIPTKAEDIGAIPEPATAGTEGQVLSLDSNLDPVWTDPATGGGDVTDVQVAGASVVDGNGIADIPYASTSQGGVIKINSDYGVALASSGKYPYINPASSTAVQLGASQYRPIVPMHQHESVFYGLAKVAGADLNQDPTPVGTYTDYAKGKIKDMIGASDAGDFAYDDAETYDAGTIGAEISSVKSALSATYSSTNPPPYPVNGVQVDGTSVVDANGVAKIPMANGSTPGVITFGTSDPSIKQANAGYPYVVKATDADVKAGTNNYKPIVPGNQKNAVFYGLAAAAGSSMSGSSNSVGNYTEAAKSAISQMLNGSVSVSGSTPSITAKAGVRYVCGEVSTLTITVPASGIIDVVFTSGSTPTVLTVTPPTGMTMMWANGFDPTSLDANTTYEINIMDGCLGVSGTWT